MTDSGSVGSTRLCADADFPYSGKLSPTARAALQKAGLSAGEGC